MWIDLKASAAQTEHFFEEASLAMPAVLPSFHVQICYEKESLKMVTGISYGEFTSDKTGQQLWDKALCRFLKKEKIVFDLINPE
jgi:hypothetical protein